MRYLSTNSKYYVSDTGFRYALLGTKNLNFGRSYANIVAIELLRRGYEIYVGKLLFNRDRFCCNQKGWTNLYPSFIDISSKDTFKREYEPLLKIKDAYPKMIIARTPQPKYTYEGIIILDIVDWLLSQWN